MREEKIDELARALAGAYRNDAQKLAAERFADITAEEAVAIQSRVVEMLGERVPVAKAGLGANGEVAAAPIMGSLVVESGATVTIPARGLIGVEVEIAARLKKDVTPEIAAGNIDDAIDSLICGIELIGTRLDDRKNAGAFGPLADNISSAGYVLGGKWEGGPAVDGLNLEIKADGVVIYSQAIKHPFGGALKPLVALGRDGYGSVAAKAGMVITTGSLCGVVAVPMPSLVTVKLGDGPEVSVRLA